VTDISRAAEATSDGELVVYPTETVYGLGADALDGDAVARVFETKGRSREKPVSLAVPTVEAAFEHTNPTEDEKRFMHEFLPGPVTVLVEARETVPAVLTAGQPRVGVRVPDQPVARELLERAGPLTSTSANVSGQPSARRVETIDESVREACAAVLDDGECPGTESTVVDVSADTIHRRGARASDVAAWLD
jgi:L-threonylcarbamoyladenylate synthase